MANRIQLRRDGAQQWANVNPILAQGELGIELDTSRLKIGDGVTQWNSLKYERPLEADSNIANTLVKRDADGNFEAGAITASLIGNAATATRLANARNFTLTGDMSGSASFDGSANINITAELNYQPGLPHYDENDLTATGTYTQLTIDSRGRVVTGSSPTTLAGYGIVDAQALDSNLTSIVAISTIGMLTRTGSGTYATRQVTGAPGRILTSNANGQTGNPLVDLADTPVVVGSYNPTGSVSLDQPETSVPESGTIHQTVNTTEFTVDRYGRLTYAVTAPISTAREGTLVAVYDNATAYARYDKVKNADDRLYEAILPINAGGGAPTHTDTSDAGSWRYLGSALTPQKGLASFSQEDFDVTEWDSAQGIAGGHVTIAQRGVDNLQLQNNRISFADGNTKEDFELDQELTATTGYRGFNYLNYVKVNDTSGNLLFGANNTGDSGAGEIDVNVRSYFSDPNIDLDGALDQIFDKYGDGNLTIQHTQNTATDRTFLIQATNAGTGNALLNITAENDITISATHVDNRVNVEDYHFQDNVLSTTNSTMVLDPNDDDDVTGLVQIRGDLQVDGTTTTVNSVTTTIQDPIMTLGGEDTLTLDDNKDRGIEFRYYDTQERFGFYGWDEDYADSNIWNGTGGYRFLYNATNTNEVYAGTDAPLIAGNLRLTTNTGSTSTTTGTLVVTGGVGISENVYIGGTVDIANDLDIGSGEFIVTAANGNIYTQGDLQVDSNVTLGNASTDTVLVNSDTTFEDDVRVVGPNTVFSITDGTTERFVVDTDNGNIHSDGTLDIDSGVTFNSTLDVDLAVTFNSTLDVDDDVVLHNDLTLDTTGKYFKITNGAQDKFTVLSTNGATDIRGTLDVGSAVHLESTLQVDGNITLGNAASDTLTVNSDTTFTDNLTVNQSVDFDSSFNVDGAVDFNSTLVVDGQTTIYDSVIFQSNNEVFNINNGAAQTQFSIDFDNGNTVIGRAGLGTGTLTVHGASTFNFPASFTNNVTIGDANTDTLTVNSVSTFTDNVTVNGNFTVDGNTVLEGNLTVNGSTTTINSTTQTLDDPIFTLGGDTAPTQADAKDRGIEFRYYSGSAKIGFFGWDNSASRFALFHNATNSSEAFTGTRSGIDAGSIKLFDTTNSTTSSSGTLIVGGGAGIGLDLRVGQDLFVTRNVDIDGNTDIAGTLDVGDDFAVSTTFTVDAQTGNTFANGTFTVNGNSTIGNAGTDAHTVNGTVQFNHALTGAARANIRDLKIGTDAANEIGTLAGNLILDSAGGTVNITDNADVDGNLNVDGNTQIDGTLTVDGNASIGNTWQDTHEFIGSVTFNQPIYSTDITADNIKIGVDGSTEISTLIGNLILDSNDGKVHITDNAEIDGFLQVDGNTTLGDSDADTLTVNATSTYTASITSEDITANNIKIGVDGTGEISTTAGNLTIDSATGQTIVDDSLEVKVNLEVDGNTTLGDASTDALTVNATSTFTAAITSTDITADNVKIGVDGASEISTTAGNLILDSFGGTVNVTDDLDVDLNLNVDGNAQVDGTLTVDGNATIGNASTDAHVVTGTVTANQRITANDGIHVNDLRLGTTNGSRAIFANGGSLVLDSSTNSVTIAANTGVSGTLSVNGNTTIGNAGTDAHTVNGTVEFNQAITSTDITADNIKIAVDSNSEISTVSGNLTLDSATGEVVVDDNLTIAGTLDVAAASVFTEDMTMNVAARTFAIQNGSAVNVFTVASSTGNTLIDGTLNVNSASVIDDTLNVTGAVDFDSTVNADGIVTITATNNASTGNNFSTSGALRVTGGVSIARDLAVGEDFKVYGDFEVDGNVVQKGNQEFRGRVEFSKNENPSNLSDDAPIMITNGGMTVTEDVYIGQNLFLGANNATTITLDGTTGNASVGGTLGVTGATTLGVLNTSTISTTGATNIGGTFSVGTTSFTVVAASGNTNIAGTLNVSGGTVIDDVFNVTGAVDLDSTLNVDGATTLNAALTQNSTSLFKDNVVLQGASKTLQLNNGSGTTKIEFQSTTGNADISGTATLGTLAVTNNSTIGGTLGVTGQITGNVTGNLTGTADKSDLADVTDTTTSNLTYYPTFVSTNNGYTEIRTDSTNLTYNPFENRLTVANFKSTTDFEVAGNLTITGAITYGQAQVGSIANHDTDALAEGVTNLYFTDERVDDRVAALVDGGTGISATYNDAGNLLSLAVDFGEINTDDLTEGSSNRFFTQARARSAFTYGTGIEHDGSGGLQVTQSEINTDNVTEGSTNLFTTAARTRGHLSAGGDLNYDASTGVFSISQSDLNVDDLISLTGRANGATHLAAFGGSTISDNNTIKGALGELETAVEARALITSLANVATTGSYNDLSNLPTLGTAAATAAADYATAAQGALADTAIQPADLAAVATSGSYNDLSNLPTLFSGAYADLTGKPTLGTAAATDSTAYATAAQGALADTAIQPADLATVATTGAYSDLSGTPTLGTAAATNSTAYATAAQGATADANDGDIDDIYTALNAIGNDASITTVAQLKAALAALTR